MILAALSSRSGGSGGALVLRENRPGWLTQKAIAELFGVKRPAITKHLGNIF